MLFSWTGLTVVIVATIAIVMFGVLFTQRLVPHHRRQKHNEVAGYLFAAIGGFYAILVAFVIVSLWTIGDTARTNSYNEANDLAAVYWVSRQMPLAQGRPLEHDTLNYARIVINQEWPLMAKRQSSLAATDLVYAMRDEAFAMNPQTMRDQTLFEEATENVTQLAADRRIRLDTIDEGVPPFLWVGLIVGGAIVIGFTFLFGVSSLKGHIAMASVFGVVVVTSLLLIYDLNSPFAGPARIEPEAFRVFLANLPPPR